MGIFVDFLQTKKTFLIEVIFGNKFGFNFAVLLLKDKTFMSLGDNSVK